MSLPLSVLLIAALVGQVGPAEGESSPREAAARLELMKKSVAAYEIQARDDPGGAYRLQEQPVLRFRNPVSRSKDGAIFLWLGKGGRPEVAVQVYCKSDGTWLQEFASLATVPIVARAADKPDWNPPRAGVEFRPVPGAPRPSESADARRRQMATLASGCVAEHFYQGKTWNTLRLLTKPLARYGDPASGVVDGSLFCFAYTTDPEVFLMLEARQGPAGPEWQYAFAPSTTQPVKCSWGREEVWSLPNRSGTARESTSETFHVRSFDDDAAGDRARSQ
ncbi:MAG: hypothetical protein P4L84_07105 [Isosphaeraceae bacterium]|nr:hypothetical protein [Isosphaeraceae bacterium]